MNEKADKLTACYITDSSSGPIDDFDTKSCNLNKTDEYFEDKYITSENYGLNSSISQDSITQDSIFDNIVYLGNGPIDEPKNEEKILEHIRHFSHKNDGFFIRIAVPTNSEGAVVLFDEKTNAIIGTYVVSRILFFAHGPIDTPEETCFAFTYSHGENTEDSVFQCLVFESTDLSAIDQVSDKFLNAFSVQADDTHSKISLSSDDSFTKILQYNFDVLLDIKEFDYKTACFCSLEPYKNGFCLYPKTSYQFVIGIHQIINDNSNFLQILNSNQKISLYLSNKSKKFVFDDFEFTSKQIKIPSVVQDSSQYNIYFLWKCDEWSTIFKEIDYKTINKLDLVISLNFEQVQENLEFVLSFPVRLDLQRSHLLDLNTKQFYQKFALVLNHVDDLKRSVISITNLTLIGLDQKHESNNNKTNESLNSYSLENNFYTLEDRVSMVKSRSFYELSPSFDEPFLSGTDIDPNHNWDNDNDPVRINLETKWHDILSDWDMYRDNIEYLTKLIREGLPSKFRSSFWMKMSNIDVNDTIFDTLYNVCATKKTPYEAVIRNDVMRTFSGHEMFKQFGGIGQDEVFRVSCAYSVYDAKLGYCQGMSFIIAALLSHKKYTKTFSFSYLEKYAKLKTN